MVSRVARKGPSAGKRFWGCNNFPTCHGTRELGPDLFVPLSSDSPRSEPYVWVTWMAEVMSGDVDCQWRAWFRSHYRLRHEAEREGGDLAAWRATHTRALSELTRTLASNGLPAQNEYAFKQRLPWHREGIIAGKMDCLVDDEDTVTVYECKTGMRKSRDHLQVMLYMWALAQEPRFAGKRMRGFLVYEDDQVEVQPYGNFIDDLTHFSGVLCGGDEAPRVPGYDCRFCPVSDDDCAERQEPPKRGAVVT